jgi:hypothetical protein
VAVQYIQFVINALVALKRIGSFLARSENTLAQVSPGDQSLS